MKSLKSVISVISLIVKYSAVVMAIIKGIQVVHSELEKIEVSESPKNEPKIVTENE